MKKRRRDRAVERARTPDSESPREPSGVMRPDSATGRVHFDLNDQDEDKSSSILPNRVVLVITLLALLFIAMIAWFVEHMPAKT